MVKSKGDQPPDEGWGGLRIEPGGLAVRHSDGVVPWTEVLGATVVDGMLTVFWQRDPPWLLAVTVEGLAKTAEDACATIADKLRERPDEVYRGASDNRQRAVLSPRSLARRAHDGRRVEGAVAFDMHRNMRAERLAAIIAIVYNVLRWTGPGLVVGTIVAYLIGEPLLGRKGVLMVVLGGACVAVVVTVAITLARVRAMLRVPRRWRCMLAPDGFVAGDVGWSWDDIHHVEFAAGGLTVVTDDGRELFDGEAKASAEVLNALVSTYRARRAVRAEAPPQ